jgi:aspartyl-tRNA(Asn)/glutamyl-tRNA(Gln) amidotransferase subunit C
MVDYWKIDKKLIERIEHVARIKLTDREKEMYAKQLSDVLAAFKQIDGIETSDSPAFHPITVENVWREDKANPTEWDPLGNSKHKEQGYFKGPRIV